MTLHTFWHSLRRSWFPAGLLLVASVFGAWIYASRTVQPTAQSTVAVRDPVSVRPGYEAAQITFDAVVDSHRLAERVAERLGEPIGDVEGALSVDVVPPASGFSVSPLYSVEAERPDPASALEMVQVAVDEAEKLYVELNQTSSEDVSATMESQLEAAKVRRRDAAEALDQFVAANDAKDLPKRLESETARAAQLQGQVDQARADLAGSRAAAQGAVVAAVDSRVAEFEEQLGVSVAERDRLRALEDRYLELKEDRVRADERLDQMRDLEQQSILSQILPVDSQVKVLDDAQLESQMIMKILVYGVAVILGLLAATTVAYLRFLRDEVSETEDTIRLAFDAPVLARIPAGSLQEARR